MSSESLASWFSTLRESSSVPEASSTCAQCISLPASMPTQTLSMTISVPRLPVCPRSTPPTAPYVATSAHRSLSAVGVSRGAEGRFLESHLRAAGILKPSSAPLGIIQNTHLDDTYKGREAFSKMKASLRRARARSRKALVGAIGRAICAVTARDARAFFEHCGYHLQGQPL